MAECRKGYAFNDPDLVSNGGWGAIITPDELRYVYSFGNELVAPNSQVITDDTLKWYIDNAVDACERDLNVKLLKRIYKYRPAFGVVRDDLSGEEGIDYEWDEPYDFNRKEFNEYIFIKLRHRPVINVQNVKFNDVASNQILDITNWVKINHEKGSLQFFPNQGSLESLPIFLGQTFLATTFGAGVEYYPDAFSVDFTSGFETVRHLRKKWKEMFSIIGMLAAINLLNDYGDGRAAAIASSSIGLAGVSESYSTTMSATNALFGARIISYREELKRFYKANKNKYGGVLFTAL